MALAGDYVEPSIFAATQQAIRNEFIDRMGLVLGRSYSGILVTYRSQKKQYVLLDDHSDQEFDVVPDLIAFVDYMKWHCPSHSRRAEISSPFLGIACSSFSR
jgi:hypothetical protein